MKSLPVLYGVRVLLLAGLYFLTAKLGLFFAIPPGNASVIWPPAGLALAALAIFGSRLWPGVTLGAFLANAMTQVSCLGALSIGVGNTLEALLGAVLIHRFINPLVPFAELRQVVLFTFSVAASSVIAATVGVSSLYWEGLLDRTAFGANWVTWWLGDGVDMLIVTPLVLMLWQTSGKFVQPAHPLELLGFYSLLLIGGGLVFGDWLSISMLKPLPYIMLPFVLYAVFRLGQVHVALTLTSLATLAVLGTVLGAGPFAHMPLHQSLFSLQMFLGASALIGFILAAVVLQRQRIEAALLESEARLREADRRKDEFLAMLGHELRNPLAPIRNAVQIMRKCGSGDPQLSWAQAVIDRQVNYLARLVDDLLDVSRIVQGKLNLKKAPVEIAAVIKQAVETSQPFIELRQHTLTVSVAEESLCVNGDGVRLTQVVANLLDNAAKYTPPGGHIWLSAARDHGEGVITVRDTGEGIASTLLPYLFEIFTQAERTLDRAQGGLGLGLTIVRNIVMMHGGRVEARSDGPGQGSEFVVRLPLGDVRANGSE